MSFIAKFDRSRQRIGFALCLSIALSVLCGHATAEYPDHYIKGVVPFPPGGGTDVFARIVADQLSKALGQPVVIENKPGAEGNIGMESVAKSNPDGYTLLFNSSAATVNPAMYQHLRFDPVKDLRPVAVLCEYYNLIVINPEKVPAKTLREFVELLRKNPGKFNVAAGGTRLGVDYFLIQNKLDVAVIPYRGAGDAIIALLRGDSDFMIVNAPGLNQHIASGKLRALAVTAPQRQPDLPQVPTTLEAGMPDYIYSSFFAAYVPSGTPPEVVKKLNSTLNTVTSTPEVIAQFRTQGAVAVQRTPEESTNRYLGDIARMKDIVLRAKIPPAD
jgi:tripartite-type tricarboxylate transporter receptor subunit TctC